MRALAQRLPRERRQPDLERLAQTALRRSDARRATRAPAATGCGSARARRAPSRRPSRGAPRRQRHASRRSAAGAHRHAPDQPVGERGRLVQVDADAAAEPQRRRRSSPPPTAPTGGCATAPSAGWRSRVPPGESSQSDPPRAGEASGASAMARNAMHPLRAHRQVHGLAVAADLETVKQLDAQCPPGRTTVPAIVSACSSPVHLSRTNVLFRSSRVKSCADHAVPGRRRADTSAPPPLPVPACALPPWASAIAWTIASPRPAPPRVRAWSCRARSARTPAPGTPAGTPSPSSVDVQLDHRARRTGRDPNRALAVPQRVVDEVAERLLQPERVSLHAKAVRLLDGERPARRLRPPLEAARDAT